MKSTDKEVIALALQKFETFSDLQSLDMANTHVSDMQPNIYQVNDSELERFHEEKLILWLLIFNQIDKAIDPKFDINNMPELSPPPPEGAKIPAGADPQSITDLDLRYKYIESININKEKTLYYNFQYELLKLNALVIDDFFGYVKGVFNETKKSRINYLNIVSKIIVNSERKNKIKDYVQSAPR